MVVEEKPVQVEEEGAGESQSKKAAKKLAKEAAKAAKVREFHNFDTNLLQRSNSITQCSSNITSRFNE